MQDAPHRNPDCGDRRNCRDYYIWETNSFGPYYTLSPRSTEPEFVPPENELLRTKKAIRMDRRTFLKSVTAGLALGAVSPVSLMADEPKRKPNVILILADDLSAKELSCYGSTQINTPTLDALAREGVLFRTAWTSPVCGPSRALLRTGKYACHTGYYANGIMPRVPVYKSHIEIGHAMQKAGYATATYGKVHDGGDPKDYGYDEYCCALKWDGYDGPKQGRGGDTGMYSIQWYWHPGLVANGKGVTTKPTDFGPDIEVDRMLDFVRRKKDKPFFVFWPTNLPHMESIEDGKWRYTSVPELDSSGRKTGGKTKGSLKTDVEYLDHLVGRIVKRLDELGIRDNTILMFCGDNGTAGYGKQKLESEVGPRVPFIVNCPDLVRKTGPSDVLTDFSDILPTLVDLARWQLPSDYKIDGHSLAPYLLGQAFTPRDHIFAQLGDARWIRDKRWLLDGKGKFWDCGDNRDEWKGYKDVTLSEDSEVISARKRFDEISNRYPSPDMTDPENAIAWEAYLKRNKADAYRPPYLEKRTHL
jgi:arylsulfatase A-like enzyme